MERLTPILLTLFFLAMVCRGLTGIVGLTSVARFFDRMIAATLIAAFTAPLAANFGRQALESLRVELSAHEVPTIGLPSIDLHPPPSFFAAMGLVAFGHVLFILFVLHLRARLARRTQARERTLRGRERVAPPDLEGGPR